MKNKLRPGLTGIVGYPLDHSLSPFIHNFSFAVLKLPYVFVKIEVPAAKLKRTAQALTDLGFVGANVTMPHKESVIGLIDSLSPEAQAVGAVNTLVLNNGKIKGYNTDSEGFARSLEKFAGRKKFESAAIFGAGGAAAAVAYALFCRFGTRRFQFICRNWRKAEKSLAKKNIFSGKVWVDFVDWANPEAAVASSDIVINATPVGMDGKRSFPISPAAFNQNQVAYDLIYSATMTPFLRVAKKGGAKTLGGLEMLLEQAALSFKLWTGREMPLAKVRKELNRSGFGQR